MDFARRINTYLTIFKNERLTDTNAVSFHRERIDMIWQFLIGGAVLGAVIGTILRKKKACSDGCPLHSSPILGVIIGGLIGMAVSSAWAELARDKLEAATTIQQKMRAVSQEVSVNRPDIRNSHSFTAMTSDNFESNIQQKGIVLVDFWAEWCGPCKMMEPVLESFARNSRENVKIYKVNIDEQPELARKFGIQGIPAFAFFNDGKLIGGLVGYQEEETLHQAVDKVKEMNANPPAAAAAAATNTTAATK